MLGSTGEVLAKAAALAVGASGWAGLAVVLADADPTGGLAGQAGWVSAGLATSILGWLFFVHLPAGSKERREIIASFQAQIDARDAAHRAQLDAITAGCRADRTADRAEYLATLLRLEAAIDRVNNRELKDREQATALDNTSRRQKGAARADSDS